MNCLNFGDLVRPRLRIAIVTETWPPEINGVALSMMQLCQGLQRLGHKILLVRPIQKRFVQNLTLNRMFGDVSSLFQNTQVFNLVGHNILKVSKAFEQFAPDVVHIVTEGPLGLIALQAAKSKNCSIEWISFSFPRF